MVGVDFVLNRETREPDKQLANNLMEECFRRGLLILTCGASTVRFCPPLVITEAQIDKALTIFEEALQALIS